MRWLYVLGLALLIWRHWKIGRPLVVFEIYLWCSLAAWAIYSPKSPHHYYVWLATQAFMLPARIAMVIELWYYATYRMLPREKNSMLAGTICLGLVWTVASWDFSLAGLILVTGHLRSRINIALCGMLLIGVLYIWRRPISLHRNIPVHAAILLVHLGAQVTADILSLQLDLKVLGREEYDRSWFAVHRVLPYINLACLAAWGTGLSPWTKAARVDSAKS